MKAWKMIFPFQRGEHFRFHAGFRGSFHGNRSGWKNDPSLLGVVSEFLFFFQILWQSHSQRPFLEKELRLHTVCFGALVFEDHGAVTDYLQGSKKLQNIRQHDTAYVYPRVLAIVMWPSRDRENQWLENLCPSWNSPLLGDILVFRGVNGPLHKKQQTTKDTRTTPPRSWKPMPLRKRQGALGFKQPKKSTSTVVPVSFLRRRHRSLKNMVGRKKQNSSFCFFCCGRSAHVLQSPLCSLKHLWSTKVMDQGRRQKLRAKYAETTSPTGKSPFRILMWLGTYVITYCTICYSSESW